MQSLVNFAKQYAEHGFSVIPTIEKRPLVKFADREPLTPDEITKFWRTHPYANIALKTDKFFVIDVDRHEDGDDIVLSVYCKFVVFLFLQSIGLILLLVQSLVCD